MTATSRYDTQNLLILTYLKSGQVITPLEALEWFNCFRLAARIYDLRNAGWPIHCDRMSMEGGKIVGHYTLHLNKALWPDAGETN